MSGALQPTSTWPRSSQVRVVSIDTNVLMQDVIRRARRRQISHGRILTAAIAGGLRVMVPPHVPDEVDEHLADFARKQGVDADLAALVWAEEYRPQLTLVDVTDFLAVLGGHPWVANTLAHDVDDAPLACMAALLGQPALSENRSDLGDAATGRGWLGYVIAVTDAVMSENAVTVLSGGASPRSAASRTHVATPSGGSSVQPGPQARP